MPRAKSELTGQQGFVGVRLTEAQRETFYKLGGAAWLRAYLNDIIARREDDATTYAKRIGSVVAVQPPRPKPVSEKPKTIWQPLIRD
jgi:hypothetical protein